MPHECVPRESEASLPMDPDPEEVLRRRRLARFSTRLSVCRVDDIWTAGNTGSSSSSSSSSATSSLPRNNQTDLNPAQSTEHFPGGRRSVALDTPRPLTSPATELDTGDPALLLPARNPASRNSQAATSSSEPSRQIPPTRDYGDCLPCTVHPLDPSPFQRTRSLRRCSRRLSDSVRGNSVLLDPAEADVVNSAPHYAERPLPPLPVSSPQPPTENDEEEGIWCSTKQEQEVLEEIVRLL
ncbi:hypothetical protein CTA2_8088 [Colletotrichum tanaceti]|uniref:Uncharacterized protein n=1 Tax=Colletotrichum tanaceti TaxID=1306861 RepID=A0A4U6XL42_9PEZI|nr:hypothetical protein CTA2_8088 [Colletotrichum tanaceti]TKW56358.1 hypothetical protein CTA1_7213 [Colletotrichum tanaceti]